MDDARSAAVIGNSSGDAMLEPAAGFGTLESRSHIGPSLTAVVFLALPLADDRSRGHHVKVMVIKAWTVPAGLEGVGGGKVSGESDRDHCQKT